MNWLSTIFADAVTVQQDPNGTPHFVLDPNNFINKTPQQLVVNIVNVLMFAIGSISIIMIIVGGLMYVLSAGDPSSTKRAKDTILYAIIGLIVAIMAFSIVQFVRGRVQ